MRAFSLPLFLKLLPAYGLIALLMVFQLHPFNLFEKRSVPIMVMDSAQEPTQKVEDPTPLFISAPQIGLSLSVQKGGYDEKRKDWILSDKSAYYAPMTVLPNDQKGNTLIYAHNFAPLFGKLMKLKIGDSVEILVQDQRTFTYDLTSVKQVVPQDLSILSYEGPPQLTLLTCGGFWDSKRQMYFFKLSSIK